MNCEYTRIDMLSVINMGINANWLHTLDDVEWREDYQCFFVRVNSPSHTLIALTHGAIFD